MDEFTERLFEMAYETCGRSGRRRRREISVRELVGAVESRWVTYRDGTIASWAARIACRVPKARLVALTAQSLP
jgi:hypothetical protein